MDKTSSDNLGNHKSEDTIERSVKKKNLVKTIIILLCIFLLVGFLIMIFVNRLGNILPVLLPPSNQQNSVDKKAGEESAVTTGVVKKEARIENKINDLKVGDGFAIGRFSDRLPGVRDLAFSAGGTLLATLPTEGKVVALADRDLNGEADGITELITGLLRPHGITFYKNYLFVATETSVGRYKWEEGGLNATFDRKLFDLPAGGRHRTRTIVFNKKGEMFVSIGSRCDVCYEDHEWIGTVIVSDSEGSSPRVYSKGLRNAVFITLNPATDQVWTTEMGRDFLGDNLPPDEVNIMKDNGDFGWPVCYGNNVHDTNFDKNTYIQNPCNGKIAPVYEIPAHSAPLGLTFISSGQFPEEWQGDLLVAYHGSWNRSTPIGYKVVRLNVEGERIVGSEEDFISGFLKGNQTVGRPVDLEFDSQGSLFISDDKANVIYKVVRKN